MAVFDDISGNLIQLVEMIEGREGFGINRDASYFRYGQKPISQR
jgi:hypothetical protein